MKNLILAAALLYSEPAVTIPDGCCPTNMMPSEGYDYHLF
jgi:hypothetical protein